jgi:NhaP-type Na+/H+ or K+/H+ antiporter
MPLGIGAVYYVEHIRHLFPKPSEATTEEEENLVAAIVPIVYWLVLFSVIFHGLLIPALEKLKTILC